jgi:hypothetical protein
MSGTRRRTPLGGRVLGALAATLLAGLSAGVATAATFMVDSQLDAVDATPGDGLCATASNACTLRAAVQEANALAGPDVVEVPAGVHTLTIAGAAEDLAATGDLDVTSDLTIEGSGTTLTEVDGGDDTRLFDVLAPATATIRDLTIRDGSGAPVVELSGGAVNNTGTLTLERVVVSDTVTGLFGGGVASEGASSVLTIRDSTIARNTIVAGGGAGVAVITGTLLVEGSLFEANFGSGALSPGALAVVDGATATVRNSTFSENVGAAVSNFNVSGFFTNGTLIMNNVTIAQDFQAAIGSDDASATTLGNVVIENDSGGCVGGGFTSTGYNVVQDASDCTILGDTTGNVLGVDPLLGPLTDNGGPTKTHPLATGSPALDAGSPALPGSGGGACEATDQRGIARPVGTRCDMGAVEGPTQPCGDNEIDLGEGCDLGRGVPRDCCDQACQLIAAGTTCRIAVGSCDVAEACDGANSQCPANAYVPAGTVCRPAADDCDAPELCPGSNFCPFDADQPDGTPCGADQCLAGAACAAGTCTGGTLDADTCIDDYLCYRVRRQGALTSPPNAFLADAAADFAASVRTTKTLCLAGDVEGAGALDPTTYAQAYQINAHQRQERQDGLQVSDRFGSLSLDAIKPRRLLVPTSADLGSPPPAVPAPGAADHYTCYTAKVSPGTTPFPQGVQVTVADLFEDRLYDVKGPRWLCRPTSKNQEGITRPAAHLVCYRVKRASGETAHAGASQIQTLNQFGSAALETVREDTLCVPALLAP